MNFFCKFEPQIWLEIIISRDAESACFKGSRTSCREIIFGIFWPNFGRKRSHHVMDASCRLRALRGTFVLQNCLPKKYRPLGTSNATCLYVAELVQLLPCFLCGLLVLFQPLRWVTDMLCIAKESLRHLCKSWREGNEGKGVFPHGDRDSGGQISAAIHLWGRSGRGHCSKLSTNFRKISAT